MAIRIDRDNRKDAHAHRMKRNHRIAARGSKDVLRFAPNFSVYVLPPDSVCLYSEDRKFFLHGELYCALASAIGEDGKSVRALVRDLEQKFPSDKIDEAIKRLLDRRFAVSKPHSARDSAAAYWASLAARRVRNREIKGMLDRKGARQVAASPLARQPVGQSGIALAAVEIAKAIATEFRTDLSDHILSLDLLGSTIVRHYVPARPQCPVCGRKELRDPSRAPAPLKLAAGGKVVMTSGGYRTVSSGATVARFRKHVSALTGVVSRLERIG